MEARDGVLGLPMIVNRKTVDPTDPSSPEVIQLEAAMGAAIDVFEGAAALGVPRRRFAPVKTTNDLLMLRSDAYVLTGDARVELAPERDGRPPFVDLDPDHFKLVRDFEERFPPERRPDRLRAAGGGGRRRVRPRRSGARRRDGEERRRRAAADRGRDRPRVSATRAPVACRSGRMRRFGLVAAVAALVAAVAATSAPAGSGPARDAATKPNVVFVLVDDLSWNLVRYMPHLRSIRRRGLTFSRYFVTDSLCCPSRASIFTGRYPHNTKVFTNTPPDGGFQVFRNRREERSTFATALRRRGYATAMMGKYLNGYLPSSLYVPPGWSQWHVGGSAYGNFNYTLNENGRTVAYGNRPQDYLTDVLARRGRRSSTRRPTPAGRSRSRSRPTRRTGRSPRPLATPACSRASAPRACPPSTRCRGTRRPGWRATRRWARGRSGGSTATSAAARGPCRPSTSSSPASSSRSARGLLDDTYIVFSSDNGFHMGEYRLRQGKQTAFDTDIRVPLIVMGPRCPGADEPRARVERGPAAHVQPARRGEGPAGGRRAQPGVAPPRQARPALAGRRADRAPRPRPPARQPGPAARQPHDLLRDSHQERRVRGVPRRRARVLQPARDPNQLSNTYGRLSRRKRARLHRKPRRPVPGAALEPTADAGRQLAQHVHQQVNVARLGLPVDDRRPEGHLALEQGRAWRTHGRRRAAAPRGRG